MDQSAAANASDGARHNLAETAQGDRLLYLFEWSRRFWELQPPNDLPDGQFANDGDVPSSAVIFITVNSAIPPPFTLTFQKAAKIELR
jgi:hypothetical protein